MWSEEKLDAILTAPSDKLIEDIRQIKGDIMILGAGGKMGPTLASLAKNACRAAGIEKRVIAVSRFSDPRAVKMLEDAGVEMVSADLLAPGTMEKLPDAENVIFMAGRKFGTDGQEPYTWAMNAWLPAHAALRYRNSNIVAFSTGNIYPFLPVTSQGATEECNPGPVGEYAQSCLARERCFEYASIEYGTKILLFRLNYAIALRYGVLYDIASRIWDGKPVLLGNGCFNCIWQGKANEIAIRSLLHTGSPAVKMNVTGPETISVRFAAERLGKLMGKSVLFEGTESPDAMLMNAAKAQTIFGYPDITLDTMLKWQAEWIMEGGRSLNKPTHFEERKGKF